MARYILVKNGTIDNAVEVDPAMINDGTPCPPELLQAHPQLDLVTEQPDLVEKQPDIAEVDENGEPLLDDAGKPVMIPQPDKVTPQAPIVEKQPDLMVDPRWTPPKGFDLIQSDVGGPGDAYPLVAASVNPNEAVLQQITVLEQSITGRRLREAILAIDNGWLADVNSEIANLRKTLVRV